MRNLTVPKKSGVMGEKHDGEMNGKCDSAGGDAGTVMTVPPIVVDSNFVAQPQDCESPAGKQGRIKEAPVCIVPELKKEAVPSRELATMCFPPGVVDELISAKEQNDPVSSSSSSSSGGSGGPPLDAVTKPNGVVTSKHRRQASAVASAKALKRKVSRQGRSTQRWFVDPKTNQSIRLVTGCVPIMKDGRILFVTASRKHEWILPKGGWEIDETMEESAIRETFEEAGVLGTLGPQLSDIEYETRKAKKRRLELEEMLKKHNKDRADLDLSLGRTDLLRSSNNELGAVDTAGDAPMGSTPSNEDNGGPVSPNEETSSQNPGDVNAEIVESDKPANSRHCAPTPEMIAAIRAANKSDLSDRYGASDETSSITSDSSGTYSFVRMSLFPLYVTEVKESWPESGRFRKVLEIEEAIEMMESRPEFRAALVEVKERGLHLVSGPDGRA